MSPGHFYPNTNPRQLSPWSLVGTDPCYVFLPDCMVKMINELVRIHVASSHVMLSVGSVVGMGGQLVVTITVTEFVAASLYSSVVHDSFP